MTITAQGWRVLDERIPILTREYSFGPGMANALAVSAAAGMIVVSPPLAAPAQAFEDVARLGPVRALVASNAFHYMGIPEWKRRFPDAALFAPAQSIARVERKTGLSGFRPLADSAGIAGPWVELVDMPHYKTGEVLVRIRTERGVAWYVTDIVLNFPVLPSHPVAKVVFRLSGSAPGLRLNNIAPLFMVRDKQALKQWLAAELEREQPRWLIPAHGDVFEVVDANRDAVRALFSTR